MAVDEHSLLQCLDLELPVQTDNSIEQDFLLHKKLLFIGMKNPSRTRNKNTC